ncbi:MAG: NTP transferase domain-containing protein [Candidatus Nitrohelix vancouverensis]|uniref:NTP transferase domain-containing protein n=1 Tax=Candidatus Nitrohelix vancouverensis TaxID=2705534 RepID=A0A7T0C4L1_9BACT|nr:MAG: NTP transferase domain-containing protein [Candidatus Nitrohelix vancouverensis]
MGLSNLAAIILAAGKGTRLKSPLAKVLQPLAGQPLLSYVLQAVRPLKPGATIAVIGYQAEQVREAFQGEADLQYVLQAEQLGTGHAAAQAKEVLQEFSGDLLILCGDMPFIRTETLQEMLSLRQSTKAACVMLSFIDPENQDFGRVVRGEDGSVDRIVEMRDATEQEKRVDELNAGVYCFEKELFFKALDKLDNQNAQNEYYLTDTIHLLKCEGLRVDSVLAKDTREVFGINSLDDLNKAERMVADFHPFE